MLKLVNEKLRQGKTYINEEAAKDVQANVITKSDLTSNPFVHSFDYGKARDGYWDGSHTAIQLEDCIDVLKVLFPADDIFQSCCYKIVFELDHSQAHKQFAKGTLIVKNFNHGFGGAKAPVKSYEIYSEKLLGPYETKLKVEDMEHHVFLPTDDPPYAEPDAPAEDTFVYKKRNFKKA